MAQHFTQDPDAESQGAMHEAEELSRINHRAEPICPTGRLTQGRIHDLAYAKAIRESETRRRLNAGLPLLVGRYEVRA